MSITYNIIDKGNHVVVSVGLPTRESARDTKRILERHSNGVTYRIVQVKTTQRIVR